MKRKMRKSALVSALYLLLMAVVCVTITGCGEYNRVLKSKDLNYRYDFAKRAFEKGKYVQAATVLTDLITPFRGTPQGEDALFLLARCYYENKDYMNSGVYFRTYYSRYPRGKHAEDARFYSGYGYYLESPDPQLDQSVTIKAIEELQGFIDNFPRSERVQQAQDAMFELQDKLTLKELQNAHLYYNLGMYLGNNYQSAIIVCQNALKNYPYTKYKEDFEILILRSKHQLAVNSVPEKQQERYRDVIDEYFSFINNWPDTSNRKEADAIYKIARNHVKE